MSDNDWQRAIDEEREYLNNNPGNGYCEKESDEVASLRAEVAKLRQACEGLLPHVGLGRRAAVTMMHQIDPPCECGICAANAIALEAYRFAREALGLAAAGEGKDQV